MRLLTQVLFVAVAVQAPAAAEERWSNPILARRADPHGLLHMNGHPDFGEPVADGPYPPLP